jgi:predicted metal-binding membrane protein
VLHRGDVIVLAAVLVAWILLLSRERLIPIRQGISAFDAIQLPGPVDQLLGLILGSVGLMGPLALPATRYVAANSFQTRRQRAVATFLLAFFAIWLLFGLAASYVIGLVRLVAPSSRSTPMNVSLVAALIAAALWQFLPTKRTSLRDCHRTIPLPPRGWAATRACLKFGTMGGARCVMAGGGLMLPMFAATQGHLMLGLMATAVAIGERQFLVLRRHRWLISVGLVGLASISVAAGPNPGNGVLGWVCAIPEPP